MKTLTVAHLSDLHLPFEPRLALGQRLSKRQLSAWAWRRRRSVHRAAILGELAADVRSAAPDHVVVTGDLINFALPAEYERAAAWLHALAPPGCISVVPGNHDALVAVAAAEGLGRWTPWMGTDGVWPYVHLRDPLALIGVNSALPTAPLLARGRIGTAQLGRLEGILQEQARADRIRVVLVHHPVAEGAVPWRRALADRARLRAVLARAGAELVLHGHAHHARLDALAGPAGRPGMIPCLCVPSSSAFPNARDEAARWHLLRFRDPGEVEVSVRQWCVEAGRFVERRRYDLCLPGRRPRSSRIPPGAVPIPVTGTAA